MKNPPHPGLSIGAEIEALGLSVMQAADFLGVTRQHLHRVIAGESSITPEMAYRLEVTIGSTADTWMRLQVNYDIAQVRKRAAGIHARRAPRREPA